MADIKISELTQVSALNNGDLVEVSQVNALAPSGYTSLKASMTDLGKKVNSDIEYTTDLADFTDKTITGAIKETAKGKNVADEYDDTQTYDKGDVVIYKNTLYICTTNNTTGAWDATKWTATNVQSLIGDLSQLTTSDKSSLVGAVNSINEVTDNNLSVATYGGTIYYRKYGKVVEVTGTGIGSTTSIAQGNEPTLATLPSGFRPKRELNPVGYSRNSFSNSRMLGYTIGTNGNIKVYAYEEISNGRFTCTYIVD